MNNPIMAIYDYNDAARVVVPRRACRLVQRTVVALHDDTDHPVSPALVYYHVVSRGCCRLPGRCAGEIDETDYRQGKI